LRGLTERPGFMTAQAASWSYLPTWFKDLQEKLPPDYVIVSPNELARLYRGYRQPGAAGRIGGRETPGIWGVSANSGAALRRQDKAVSETKRR
jgi:hypothetical protein